MSLFLLRCHCWVAARCSPPATRSRSVRAHRDRGQATAEYALVMLGAAVIALLVVTWATSGGGAGKIGRLFDRVIDAVVSRV